jgi:hypothetical protein
VGAWLSAIATLVGLASSVTAVVRAYRERTRPTKLQYEVIDRPAFPNQRMTKTPFSIEFDNSAIQDPNQVNLYLKADGPKDIRTTEFDGNELSFRLGAPLVALIDQTGFEEESIKGDAGDDFVRISPQLLKCGELLQATFVVDGKPSAKFEAKLADIKLVEFDHTIREPAVISRKWLMTLAVLSPLLLILSGVGGWYASNKAHATQYQLAQFAQGVNAASQRAQAALAANPQDSMAAQKILESLGSSSDQALQDAMTKSNNARLFGGYWAGGAGIPDTFTNIYGPGGNIQQNPARVTSPPIIGKSPPPAGSIVPSASPSG